MLSDIKVLTLFGDPPYGDIACVCEWLYVSVCVWEGDANLKKFAPGQSQLRKTTGETP